MNIVLTGSLRNIGKPLATKLVQTGHSVTVISSNAGRTPAIEALGAKAAIGNMFDAAFLALGFGHVQSFSKLFKAKTNLSPLAFRASIN